MKKNVFAAALLLALGVGTFAACSSDDVVNGGNGTQTGGGTTYMSVVFSLPNGRAARSQDYNYIGEWSGRDEIKGYKAYIFNAGTGLLEAVQVLSTGDFATATNPSNQVVVTPNKAVRVQPGNKVVYVVVNPNAKTDALLPEVIATTTQTAFDAAYKSENLATLGAGVYTSAIMGSPTPTSADDVAQITGSAASTKDIIVMTGEPAGLSSTFTVADNVTEAQATLPSGAQNQAEVTVKRVVARVITTSTAASYQLDGDDPYTPGVRETNYRIGEVKGLHFVTAQSERTLKFQQAQGTDLSSTTDYWNSPAFAQAATTNYTLAGNAEPAAIMGKYDYTNLWKKRANANVLGGNEVHVATPSSTNWTAQEIGELFHDTDFILPTTHKYVAPAPAAPYEYRKGNTAYVLVRAAFVPNEIQVGNDYSSDPAVAAAMAAGNASQYYTAVSAAVPNATFNPDGTLQTPVQKVAFSTLTGSEPAQLVYGQGTKKFYSSVYASQDKVFQGEPGQPIQIFNKVEDAGGNFLGYKMLYFAWVNPDVVGPTYEWYNSPVYRNNIYHVEISGIAGLGENWNPLVPATPTNPNNDPNHPNNPDPFIPNPQVNIPVVPTNGTPVTPTPVTPPTPPTPPIKPEDPLTQGKTYMSVKTTVLPWKVHSYKFILKN